MQLISYICISGDKLRNDVISLECKNHPWPLHGPEADKYWKKLRQLQSGSETGVVCAPGTMGWNAACPLACNKSLPVLCGVCGFVPMVIL